MTRNANSYHSYSADEAYAAYGESVRARPEGLALPWNSA